MDLQWDYCSGLLTLICNHNNTLTDPLWVHNGTPADGVTIQNIPGANYTKTTPTRHVAVISGLENVMAVDSFSFQCVYHLLNNAQARSNKVQYYWGKLILNSLLHSISSYLYMQFLPLERNTTCPTRTSAKRLPNTLHLINRTLKIIIQMFQQPTFAFISCHGSIYWRGWGTTCVCCPLLQVTLKRAATLTMALAPATTTAL